MAISGDEFWRIAEERLGKRVEIARYTKSMGNVHPHFGDKTLGRTVILVDGVPVIRGYVRALEQQVAFCKFVAFYGDGDPLGYHHKRFIDSELLRVLGIASDCEGGSQDKCAWCGSDSVSANTSDSAIGIYACEGCGKYTDAATGGKVTVNALGEKRTVI